MAMIEYRYDPPFKLTGKINKLTFKLGPELKDPARSQGRTRTYAGAGAGSR